MTVGAPGVLGAVVSFEIKFPDKSVAWVITVCMEALPFSVIVCVALPTSHLCRLGGQHKTYVLGKYSGL